MPKFRIGRHINIAHGFVTAPQYANDLGCTVIQIFFGNPQQVVIKARPDEELLVFGEQLSLYKMKMVVHASYTINLCHPVHSKQHQASVNALIRDLTMSDIVGKRCMGVVIHMGKNMPDNNISDETALANYVAGLKYALHNTPDNTIIILETGASQGNEVGSTLGGLSSIFWGLNKKERIRVKFCIDTCHIWASGYDISNSKKVIDFFKEFNNAVGIDRIACMHFNDSKTDRGSHVDRHADLGHGYIPVAGLKSIARIACKYKIPLILETPLDSVNNHTNRDVTFQEELAKVKKYVGVL